MSTASGRSTNRASVRPRIVQNCLLIWIDVNAYSNDDETQGILKKLRDVINDISLFTEPDACIAFLQEVKSEKIFLISSGALGQVLVPEIHSLSSVDAIFILGGNRARHEQWTTRWPKVKGVYTNVKPIVEALRASVTRCNQDLTPMSFVEVDTVEGDVDLNGLDPSFMYTQIFKKILLDMEHDDQSRSMLIEFCRDKFIDNSNELAIIDEFSRAYRSNKAIWWYTRECFLYRMLNRSLRLLEGDIIINMGFFIHDLHRQLEQLHNEQIRRYNGKSFVIFRGQGLSPTDFAKLKKTQGGLIAFNSFLSTSKDQSTSLRFARSSAEMPDTVGIFFIMTIDPKLSSTPFADISEFGYFHSEDEILFSMNTVFRIGKVKRMDNNDRLFEVPLQLTSDDDPQLRELTARIEQEVKGEGWGRAGQLMLRLGQPNKAEELYLTLLDQTENERDEAYYYHQLGYIKDKQGNYKEAIEYYRKSLSIEERIFPSNHLNLANSCNNIGGVYQHMGEYAEALSYYEKALDIQQKILPSNHPELANSYNNIGLVYSNLGEHSKALLYYEKALDIYEKTLPQNHPTLASSFNNIGSAYYNMIDNTKALSYYEKAFEIRQKSLPANHPDLAISYNNFGLVHKTMGNYTKALSNFEKALKIRERSLAADHPDLASSFNNIGSVYNQLREYAKALDYHEKALEIRQKSLSDNHPDLANSYSNIGSVYNQMEEYGEALYFHEKALKIRVKILPGNHRDLAASYSNLGGIYAKMQDYDEALIYYEKALNIQKKMIPQNYPNLASFHGKIGLMYDELSEYPQALSNYQNAADIYEKHLSGNHPSLAGVYKNIGGVYYNMGEYANALSYLERAQDIWKTTLPANHPQLESLRKSIESVKKEF